MELPSNKRHFNGIMECYCQLVVPGDKQDDEFSMTLNGQEYKARIC